jgi:DNA gyrase subunit A
MLKYYLLHQEEVITRRTQYDLNKAEERAHILQGLLIALDNIDRVIKIIRESANVAVAKAGLMEEFSLSDAQAQAIVDMRLRALTGLEREKLEAELNDLLAKIAEYKEILADKKKLLTVIKTEISAISEKYGDDRRTQIGFDEFDLSMEDLIPQEEVIIARTNMGYIKRMTPDNFKSQHRGGKGIKGMQTIDEDFIEDLFMTNTHHSLTFFTNQGRAYKLKAYEIPESGRTSRGTAIINLLQLQPEEQITAVIPVDVKNINDSDFMFLATKKGIVKKTQLGEYANIRKTGIQAINLRDDDELIEVKMTDNTKDIILVTKLGQCIRFNEKDVRPTGRSSMGVIGMNLLDEDEVVGMQLSSQGDSLLFVSEKGLGKLTDMDEFTVQHRGGKGIKCYKISEKTGNVIGVKAVDDTREVLLITMEGVIIRLYCKDISKLGRITSGVKLINLDENVTVATIAKVSKNPQNEKGEETEMFEETEDNIEE